MKTNSSLTGEMLPDNVWQNPAASRRSGICRMLCAPVCSRAIRRIARASRQGHTACGKSHCGAKRRGFARRCLSHYFLKNRGTGNVWQAGFSAAACARHEDGSINDATDKFLSPESRSLLEKYYNGT